VCEGLNMVLASVHTPDEERFIVTGIRQSSDYSAGTIYWLGARIEDDEFSWIDGSALGYHAWPPYNDTEELDNACLGIQPSGLYWTLHRCSITGGYVCKRRLNPENLIRNNTIEGTEGIITSLNHPAVYDNDLDYYTMIKGPLDTRLVFVFQTLELEYQTDCLYDYIEVIFYYLILFMLYKSSQMKIREENGKNDFT
ncbi:unnamed protein product, partial [Leptidea sinapis]